MAVQYTPEGSTRDMKFEFDNETFNIPVPTKLYKSYQDDEERYESELTDYVSSYWKKNKHKLKEQKIRQKETRKAVGTSTVPAQPTAGSRIIEQGIAGIEDAVIGFGALPHTATKALTTFDLPIVPTKQSMGQLVRGGKSRPDPRDFAEAIVRRGSEVATPLLLGGAPAIVTGKGIQRAAKNVAGNVVATVASMGASEVGSAFGTLLRNISSSILGTPKPKEHDVVDNWFRVASGRIGGAVAGKRFEASLYKRNVPPGTKMQKTGILGDRVPRRQIVRQVSGILGSMTKEDINKMASGGDGGINFSIDSIEGPERDALVKTIEKSVIEGSHQDISLQNIQRLQRVETHKMLANKFREATGIDIFSPDYSTRKEHSALMDAIRIMLRNRTSLEMKKAGLTSLPEPGRALTRSEEEVYISKGVIKQYPRTTKYNYYGDAKKMEADERAVLEFVARKIELGLKKTQKTLSGALEIEKLKAEEDGRKKRTRATAAGFFYGLRKSASSNMVRSLISYIEKKKIEVAQDSRSHKFLNVALGELTKKRFMVPLSVLMDEYDLWDKFNAPGSGVTVLAPPTGAWTTKTHTSPRESTPKGIKGRYVPLGRNQQTEIVRKRQQILDSVAPEKGSWILSRDGRDVYITYKDEDNNSLQQVISLHKLMRSYLEETRRKAPEAHSEVEGVLPEIITRMKGILTGRGTARNKETGMLEVVHSNDQLAKAYDTFDQHTSDIQLYLDRIELEHTARVTGAQTQADYEKEQRRKETGDRISDIHEISARVKAMNPILEGLYNPRHTSALATLFSEQLSENEVTDLAKEFGRQDKRVPALILGKMLNYSWWNANKITKGEARKGVELPADTLNFYHELKSNPKFWGNIKSLIRVVYSNMNDNSADVEKFITGFDNLLNYAAKQSKPIKGKGTPNVTPIERGGGGPVVGVLGMGARKFIPGARNIRNVMSNKDRQNQIDFNTRAQAPDASWLVKTFFSDRGRVLIKELGRYNIPAGTFMRPLPRDVARIVSQILNLREQTDPESPLRVGKKEIERAMSMSGR
jgi:hypothetical protein